MGRRGTGYLRQNFKITLDVDKLCDYLSEMVVKAIESEKTRGKQTFTDVEADEAYFEGGEFFMTGKYDTAFESWHCDATLESPAENELEYEGIEGWGDGLLCMLPDNLKELITVSTIKASEDDIEFPYDEW